MSIFLTGLVFAVLSFVLAGNARHSNVTRLALKTIFTLSLWSMPIGLLMVAWS